MNNVNQKNRNTSFRIPFDQELQRRQEVIKSFSHNRIG